MIESFVDLTYRGLALARRIQLTEVRPSTAFVELAAPMPVGTPVAIVTEDGLALDATVAWIHEQVAGAERAAGMVLAPVLAGDAAAWWQARVTLPEDAAPRPRPTRSRPVTVRPRSVTERTKSETDRSPPPEHVASPPASAAPADADHAPDTLIGPVVGSAMDDGPTIIADLQARVTAAAGLEPRASEVADARDAPAMRALPDASERPTVAMQAVEQSTLAQATMRTTGEHDVVDDGKATMIMEALDPATLGIDLPSSSSAGMSAITDEPSAPVITIEADGDDDGEADGEAPSAGPSEPSAGDKPPGKPGKRRRKRR